MDKKILFVLFIISVLSLVGCATETGKQTTTAPFVGGSTGLEINFIAGEPPEEALDEGQFPFIVTTSIENKGEWDVAKEEAVVELRGFRPADFNNPERSKSPDEDLSKTYIDVDGNVIPGTFTHVSFDGFNYAGSLQANNPFPILADICYKYGTKSQLDICYLDDLTEANEVCEVKGPKPIFSSSAPVSVENLKEEIAGSDKVSFSFDIVHRGSGLLSVLDSNCNDADELTNKNKVWVEVNTDLPGLECSGLVEGGATTGYATLYSGKRHIRCTQDVPGDGDYIKKASVIVKYDYKETIKTEILIKHVG
jgi:hypothetical protein